MSSTKKYGSINTRERISALWIVVMINMAFADILSFMLPGNLSDIMTGNTPLEITQEIMLAFAILLEIPIVMIFLSRVLNGRANRLANIIASVITIIFVIGGGSASMHYIFFAAVEVTAMLLIIRLACKSTEPDFQN